MAPLSRGRQLTNRATERIESNPSIHHSLLTGATLVPLPFNLQVGCCNRRPQQLPCLEPRRRRVKGVREQPPGRCARGEEARGEEEEDRGRGEVKGCRGWCREVRDRALHWSSASTNDRFGNLQDALTMEALSTSSMDGKLRHAAMMGQLAEVRRLIASGVDVCPVNPGGCRTALHYAAEGREDIVRILLDAGAAASSRDLGGWTPLHCASVKDGRGVVKMLLDAGADVSAVCVNGWTALHLAAKHGRDVAVEALLDAGAGMEEATFGLEEFTPLHVAAAGGRRRVVRILLAAGADVSARDAHGHTPSDLAYGPVKAMLTAAEQQRSLAFAMGWQERLGAASLVQGLEPELLRMVMACLAPRRGG